MTKLTIFYDSAKRWDAYFWQSFFTSCGVQVCIALWPKNFDHVGDDTVVLCCCEDCQHLVQEMPSYVLCTVSEEGHEQDIRKWLLTYEPELFQLLSVFSELNFHKVCWLFQNFAWYGFSKFDTQIVEACEQLCDCIFSESNYYDNYLRIICEWMAACVSHRSTYTRMEQSHYFLAQANALAMRYPKYIDMCYFLLARISQMSSTTNKMGLVYYKEILKHQDSTEAFFAAGQIYTKAYGDFLRGTTCYENANRSLDGFVFGVDYQLGKVALSRGDWDMALRRFDLEVHKLIGQDGGSMLVSLRDWVFLYLCQQQRFKIYSTKIANPIMKQQLGHWLVDFESQFGVGWFSELFADEMAVDGRFEEQFLSEVKEKFWLVCEDI